MAEIVKTSVAFGATGGALAFAPLTGQDFFRLDNADGRVTLLIRNGNTQNATVTLCAGDGQLAPLGDVAVGVAGSQTVAVPLARVDSARVKLLTGDGRGTVQIRSTVDAGGALASLTAAVLSVE